MRWIRGVVAGMMLGAMAGTGAMAQQAAAPAEAPAAAPAEVPAAAAPAEAPAAAVAAVGNTAALLIEAPQGDTKAQTFQGTVDWKTGADAAGRPTLVGTAAFPDRAVDLSIVIGTNPDATVPATHLVDLQFKLGEQFPGKAIAQLAGIIFKDEQIGQGQPLVGAGARVTDNSFLFALANGDDNLARNMALLGERNFMELRLIYGSGERAVLTLGLGGAREAFAQFAATALKK